MFLKSTRVDAYFEPKRTGFTVYTAPGNLAPPKYGPPGPNFLGNMPPPPRAIFPRKFGPPFGNLAPLYKHGC